MESVNRLNFQLLNPSFLLIYLRDPSMQYATREYNATYVNEAGALEFIAGYHHSRK